MEQDKPKLNKEDYTPPEPKREKPQLIPVRLLTSKGGASLVEWDVKGHLNRATVQAADVVNGCVDAAALATAIPYGLPWEEVKFNQPKPEQLADALRRADIWTREDLFTKPNAAISALQSLYRVHLGALVEFTKSAKKE